MQTPPTVRRRPAPRRRPTRTRPGASPSGRRRRRRAAPGRRPRGGRRRRRSRPVPEPAGRGPASVPDRGSWVVSTTKGACPPAAMHVGPAERPPHRLGAGHAAPVGRVRPGDVEVPRPARGVGAGEVDGQAQPAQAAVGPHVGEAGGLERGPGQRGGGGPVAGRSVSVARRAPATGASAARRARDSST